MKPSILLKKWTLLLCLWSPPVGANALPETLEVEVWNASSSTLQSLEKRLVHELAQEKKDTSFLYYLLSLTYLRMFTANTNYVKGLQQTLQLAQEAIELQPESEYGYLAMAEMLFVLGKKQEASFLLHTLEAQAKKKNRPLGWRLAFYLARIESRDPASLLAAVEPLLQQEPSEAVRNIILPYLVTALQSSAFDSTYLDRLVELEAQFSTPFLRHELIQLLVQGNQFTQAQRICQKGLQKDPSDSFLLIQAQVIRYRYLHQGQAAYRALLTIEKTVPDALLPQVWMHIGLLLQQRGRSADSQRYMKKALVQKNFSPEFLEVLRQEYTRAHEEAAFHALLKNVQPDFSSHTALYAQLGRTASHLKRYPEALGWYDQGLVLEPEEATLHYNKSCVLALQGKAGEALHWLQQALELRPDLSFHAKNDADFISIQQSQAFQSLLLHSIEQLKAKASALADKAMLTPLDASK
jgi:tetratricopeptide (TPR) repeat protein